MYKRWGFKIIFFNWSSKLDILKNLAKKILSSKLFNYFGISIINFDLLKYVHHYKWVFKFCKVPNQPIVYNQTKQVTDKDIHLCKRLIKAYRNATHYADFATGETISELWSFNIKQQYGELFSALESANPEYLASILSFMFRESFVCGVASGDLVSHSKSTIGSKIWSMKY